MKVDHIAILVDNLDDSQAWYEEKCKAELIFEDEKYKRMKVENTNIALISKHHYQHAHIGLLVENTDKFPENGKIIHHRDGTIGCYLTDPDGNVVEYIYYSDELKEDMKIDKVT